MERLTSGVHGLAAQDRRDAHHVEQGRIRTRTYADLIYLDRSDAADRVDVVRAERLRGERLELAEIDVYNLGVFRVGVRQYLDPVVFTSLRFKERESHVVGREKRTGRSQLGAHIGDGRARGNGEIADAFAAVFDYFADAAFDGQTAQYFENYIFCRYPRPELARKDTLTDSGMGI
jgi:hypothetical protein